MTFYIFAASLLIGCLIFSSYHKQAEEQRQKLFANRRAIDSYLSDDTIWIMVNIAMSIAVIAFIVFWPIMFIAGLLKSRKM